MDGKTNNAERIDPLATQLLVIRLIVLVIPIYLFSFSSTCGILGPSISQDYSILRAAMVAMVPGIGFAVIGVLWRSNYALCLSGGAATVIIVINRAADIYLTILDFVLLLLFLEVSTTLASFSEMARSIALGNDENISFAYRRVLKEYLKRIIITASVTVLVSLVSLFFVVTYAASVSTLGIGLLAVIALFLIFIAIAIRYREG
jgi:hypothetical protein